MDADTIAAISTSPGKAAISIVRVSGPDALVIADRVFTGSLPAPSHRPGGSFAHGFVTASDHADADEVILLVYRAPHSYTREDVVEFQGHGGRFAAQRILQALTQAGARPADPGEFTRRAFLSGRIDLVQAEAVMDLIAAQSDRAAQAAVDQLEGFLSSSLAELYAVAISTASDLSALLDFSEDDIVARLSPSISQRVVALQERIQTLLATWREGRVLREGVLVVICGQPNTGKSTLMNALLSSRRSIVTDVPGTTRDTIEEGFEVDGFPIRLVDTAGIRDADCKIEREGVQRTRDVMARADIILYLLDASQPLNDGNIQQLASLDADRTIVVLNKADLGVVVSEKQLPGHPAVTCALINETGLDELRAAIVSRIGVSADMDSHIAISQRHRRLLELALHDLDSALEELQCDFDHLAPAAMFLRSASISIGEILGRTYTADLLDSVFSRFCIGK